MQGLAQAVAVAFEAGVAVVGAVLVQGGCDVATGLCLAFDEVPEAVRQVAVFVFFCEFAVVNVRRADAFVDVLGGEVVAQHPCGARVAVLAAHPVVKGAAALVEGLDEGGVRARELGLPPAVVVVVRVEVAGFGVNVVGKCGVGGGHVFLHLAVREGELHDERAAAVNEGAGEDEQRVGVPRLGGVVGERGVDGDGQPTEGDGTVTQPGGPHVGEGEGHQQHGDDVGDGVIEGELHGERGGSKGG